MSMAELVAQGSRPEQRWRRKFSDGETVFLGRGAGLWTVPWDPFLSRRHAELQLEGNRLHVRQLQTANNPIFFRGARSVSFELIPGEHFVIGSTTFTFLETDVPPPESSNRPAGEYTLSAHDLERIRYRNADQRLDVLGRLPDVISSAANDRELFLGVTNILLAGIRRATVVALVIHESQSTGSAVRVLHWDRRRSSESTFRPSDRLVQDALERRRQSVVYWWRSEDEAPLAQSLRREGVDWAYCSPVRGDTCKGWGLYVAGKSSGTSDMEVRDPKDLEDDVKFTELVANVLGALRNVRYLQQKQASLTQFFSPAVLGKFSEENPEIALEAKMNEVAVLFCDLRGFSRETEHHADDLMRLLERVSKALGVMTSHILDNGGVVGDFQGDAAMGFWGWPVAQPDIIERACLAAQGIRQHFEAAARRPDHPLARFRVGIGVATGQAVAGKIGTMDQAKIGVFGPIVNLASRLEGMSKLLFAPVLLDEKTAEHARKHIPREVGRVRRVAIVQPYGLDSAVEVSELLPPESEFPELTDQDIRNYEEALDRFIEGKWEESFALLHRVPPIDRVKDFLTVTIAQHNRTPPPNWNGVIPLTRKQ
ncbi:MAG: adenylate/guanylate cyclase domain-containing protein [Planctomycetota bacterium]